MIYVLLIVIVACANDLFYIVPNYHIKGVFNVVDVGLFLMMVLLAYLLSRSRHQRSVVNGIALLVVLYIFFVMIHVAIANINYDQSIVSGLIKSRHQFYYLSYFVFLLALDDDRKAERFLNMMGVVAIFLLVVSAVNYFGFTVFHEHMWAEGQGYRSGVKRAFVPAMNLIGLAFTWYFTRYVRLNRVISRPGFGALAMFGGLLFRQTRGRIIAATMDGLWILLREKRVRLAAEVFGVAVVLGLMLAAVTDQNLLLESYTTAYSDVTKSEGTWQGRGVTLKNDIETFLEHPVFGSGALIIRQSGTAELTAEELQDAYQGDLGYPHWLKNYGFVGVAWLVFLWIIFYRNVLRRRRQDPESTVNRFAEYQFMHVMIGAVTINYLVKVEGILVLCLALALATRPVLTRHEEEARVTALASVTA